MQRELALLVYSVSLSSAVPAAPVSVAYSTTDDTATAPGDYTSSNGTLMFAAGVTTQSIDIEVNGDTADESDEQFTVTLSSPTNASLSVATATGTIVDDDGVVTLGIDQRPNNLTCLAPERQTSNASIDVVDAFPNLPNIAQPTKMVLEPGNNPRWWVLQREGEVVAFDPANANSVTTLLDISSRVRTVSEGGLLSLAFHPNYPATPEVFLSYTTDFTGPNMRSVISRFVLDDVRNPGAGTQEQVILVVNQDSDNHNGGDLAFGADGYLYVAFGDGGGAGDPRDRSQDTTRLLGSMLRLDVTGPNVNFPGNPYEIPAGNPFAGNAKCGPGGNADDCPEIYAWGFRNPWRWTFDAPTGDLWLGDVGQGSYEEINRVELGGNYGWRCREGAHDFNTTGCGGGLIDPVAEYGRTDGQSVTGGFVYRGSAIPQLSGRYVFADYSSGRIWALSSDGQGGFTNEELIDTNFGLSSFGIGADNELYLTDLNNSRIRRIVDAGGGSGGGVPTRLSETGCVDPSNITTPYAGLVPYAVNAAFWSDGADKDRLIGLPDGTAISRDANEDWVFPRGTVIVKNFRLQGRLIETRHLMRHPDGVWAGYTYEWNSQQTEATRVAGGRTVSIAGQNWIFPSESQCMECHTSAAGFALGPETAQLNGLQNYAGSGRVANQLATLDHLMMFVSPLQGSTTNLPALEQPFGANGTLEARARAYLHTNCAGCHQSGGPTPSTMDLHYDTALRDTDACDVQPMEGDLGIANARLIAPGDAARSLVVNRASRRDTHGMPPLGSNIVDAAGIDLLSSWINQLGGCN